MTKNCKPNDLALVVSGEGTGRVVECLWSFVENGENAWAVTPEAEKGKGYWDKNLRPLRPDEGDDETLAWAGKPNEVTG